MWPPRPDKQKYEAVAVDEVEVHEISSNGCTCAKATKPPQLSVRERRNNYIVAAFLLLLLAGLFAFVIIVFPKLAPYLAEPKDDQVKESTESSGR